VNYQKPKHYSMAVVDIEQFGSRNNADQVWLRDRMYEILRKATEAAGLDWSQCAREDRGDAVILLIPSHEAKQDIADGFVRYLNVELVRYAARSAGTVRMRMRLALHFGEVGHDGNGWYGADLNTACRLVELPELKATLREEVETSLVVITSSQWFDAVVRHDPGSVDHRQYRRISFKAKELRDIAWIFVPGGISRVMAMTTPDEQDKQVAP